MAGLDKSERLKNRKDIQELYQSGRFYRGKNHSLVVRRAGTKRKVAVAVARGCGGAVRRNLIKRKLREAYRRQKQHFPDNAHFMLIGKAGVLTCDFESLQVEIAEMALKVAEHGSDSS